MQVLRSHDVDGTGNISCKRLSFAMVYHRLKSINTCFCLTLKCQLIICILCDFSCICFHLLIFFFKINLFDFFHEHQSQGVKYFGSRSGPVESRSGQAFCRCWPGYKLFAKNTSRRQENKVNLFSQIREIS